MTQEKTKIIYKGKSPVEICAGEFRGYFEPDKEYRIENRRFAVHLLEQEENFELVPAHTKASLMKLAREVLDDTARNLGIEKPEDFKKKEDLADAILKQEEALNV